MRQSHWHSTPGHSRVPEQMHRWAQHICCLLGPQLDPEHLKARVQSSDHVFGVEAAWTNSPAGKRRGLRVAQVKPKLKSFVFLDKVGCQQRRKFFSVSLLFSISFAFYSFLSLLLLPLCRTTPGWNTEQLYLDTVGRCHYETAMALKICLLLDCGFDQSHQICVRV